MALNKTYKPQAIPGYIDLQFDVFDALGLDPDPNLTRSAIIQAFLLVSSIVRPDRRDENNGRVPAFPTYEQAQAAKDYLLASGATTSSRRVGRAHALLWVRHCSTWNPTAERGTLEVLKPRPNIKIFARDLDEPIPESPKLRRSSRQKTQAPTPSSTPTPSPSTYPSKPSPPPPSTLSGLDLRPRTPRYDSSPPPGIVHGPRKTGPPKPRRRHPTPQFYPYPTPRNTPQPGTGGRPRDSSSPSLRTCVGAWGPRPEWSDQSWGDVPLYRANPRPELDLNPRQRRSDSCSTIASLWSLASRRTPAIAGRPVSRITDTTSSAPSTLVNSQEDSSRRTDPMDWKAPSRVPSKAPTRSTVTMCWTPIGTIEIRSYNPNRCGARLVEEEVEYFDDVQANYRYCVTRRRIFDFPA